MEFRRIETFLWKVSYFFGNNCPQVSTGSPEVIHYNEMHSFCFKLPLKCYMPQNYRSKGETQIAITTCTRYSMPILAFYTLMT